MRILCGVLLLVAVSAPPVMAQSLSRGFAKNGMYVGASFLPNFTLDGRVFDGETQYQEIGGDEIGILPKLDTQHMVRAVLGFKSRPFALEFSYERTNHNGTFLDEPARAHFNAVNVDSKLFFFTHGRVQPHVVIGLAVPWLTVEDGAFDGDGQIDDARWRGLGLNTEAGVTFFPHPRLGVSAGYAFRLIGFRRATGVSGTVFELKPPFKETSGSPVITAFYIF
jgi:opacity protein-like surface antigen